MTSTPRRVVMLLALLAPALAHGAQWVKLKTPAGGDQFYYDRGKLVLRGDEVTYWKRVVFAVPQVVKAGAARSALYRERIDCVEHTLQNLGYVLFGEDGSQLEPFSSPESVPQPVIPDTVGDAFERALCPMVAARRREAEEDRLRQVEMERRVIELQEAVGQLREALERRNQQSADPGPAAEPGSVPPEPEAGTEELPPQ